MSDRVDDLEARVEALSRARLHNSDRIEELQEENERLRERLAKVEAVVDTNPEKVKYEALTRERKVFRIQSKLVEIAENTNGKASMDYGDVITMFSGRPSRGHAYDLMKIAGNPQGFEYQQREEGNDRVVVKTDDVNDLAVFHGANTSSSEEAI